MDESCPMPPPPYDEHVLGPLSHPLGGDFARPHGSHRQSLMGAGQHEPSSAPSRRVVEEGTSFDREVGDPGMEVGGVLLKLLLYVSEGEGRQQRLSDLRQSFRCVRSFLRVHREHLGAFQLHDGQRLGYGFKGDPRATAHNLAKQGLPVKLQAVVVGLSSARQVREPCRSLVLPGGFQKRRVGVALMLSPYRIHRAASRAARLRTTGRVRRRSCQHSHQRLQQLPRDTHGSIFAPHPPSA